LTIVIFITEIIIAPVKIFTEATASVASTVATALKAIDKLPTYVTSSLDNMPSSRLYEGDLQFLMTYLNNMNDRLDKLGATVATICSHVTGASASAPVTVNQAGQRSSATAAAPGNSTTAVSVQPAGADQQPAGGLQLADRDWPSLVSTPYAIANRFAVLGSTTDDDEHVQQFSTVVSKRAKRVYRQSNQQTRTERSIEPAAAQVYTDRRRRQPVVYGKLATTSTISAAQKMKKKSCFLCR